MARGAWRGGRGRRRSLRSALRCPGSEGLGSPILMALHSVTPTRRQKDSTPARGQAEQDSDGPSRREVPVVEVRVTGPRVCGAWALPCE